MRLSTIAPGARADGALRAAVERLLVELDPQNPPLAANLEQLIADPSARLILAVTRPGPRGWPGDPRDCHGMLTLTLRNSLTRRSALIDHVVVDPAQRRAGIGKLLVTEALSQATGWGASRVDLTSAPERAAAQALYRSLGFEQRRTNHWRYRL